MNVMGVGPLELLVVLVIAFLVLGPDRMSSTARSLGKIVRDLRQQTSGLPRTLEEFLEQPEDMSTTPAEEPKAPAAKGPKAPAAKGPKAPAAKGPKAPAAKGPKAPAAKGPKAPGVPRPRRPRNAGSAAQDTSAENPKSEE